MKRNDKILHYRGGN
ncbi:hypothetical protein O0475_002852 [Escherichia coli]|nr:hypothetical protein [Escherichia coli]